MITLKFCPICGNDQITQYQRFGIAPRVAYEVMPGVNVNAVVMTHYFICQNCKTIFQNPRLSDSELDNFYSQGYYRRTINSTDEEMDRDEAYRAKFDAEIIKKRIGKVTSHLDMGSSRGYLLEAMGANVKVGVELNVNYVKVKGVAVYADTKQIPQKSFDLVTAIHVLEHVSAPVEYLRTMAQFAGTSGHVVVEVPTWKSPGGPLRLAHLYHFEPDVLKFLCTQVGLTVLHVEFTPHLMVICKADNN